MPAADGYNLTHFDLDFLCAQPKLSALQIRRDEISKVAATDYYTSLQGELWLQNPEINITAAEVVDRLGQQALDLARQAAEGDDLSPDQEQFLESIVGISASDADVMTRYHATQKRSDAMAVLRIAEEKRLTLRKARTRFERARQVEALVVGMALAQYFGQLPNTKPE